jgi:hypothetical protein
VFGDNIGYGAFQMFVLLCWIFNHDDFVSWAFALFASLRKTALVSQ